MKTLAQLALVCALAWASNHAYENYKANRLDNETIPEAFVAHAEVDQPNMTPAQMQTWYEGYSDEYFGGKLPKNVTFDLDEHDPEFMATTRFIDDHFRVSFNLKYAQATRTDLYLLLHESCHVSTWSEVHPNGQPFSDAGKEHGPRWRACMLRIDSMGGFRSILIDGYTEDVR